METAGAGPEPVPAIHLQGITKRFGAIVACDDVDLLLHHGRIHGVLGENGAGKSTLMKILIGLVPADAGAVFIDGERQIIRDPPRRSPARDRDGPSALQPGRGP